MKTKQHRTHKIRLYPNAQQRAKLLRVEELTRVVYNWAVLLIYNWYEDLDAHRREDRPSLTKLSRLLTQYKQQPDMHWLYEAPMTALIKSVVRAWRAFHNLYRHCANPPRLHGPKCNGSFDINNTKAYITGQKLTMHKIGTIKMAEPFRYNARPLSYTVIRNGFGKAAQWWVAVECETEVEQTPKYNDSIGIDVGITHLATCSDGRVYDMPSLTSKRLTVDNLYAILKRKKPGSNNYRRALYKLDIAHRRLRDTMRTATHKISSTIANLHHTIVIEGMNIKEIMTKKPNLPQVRKAINLSGMGRLLLQLKYKATDLIVADKWFASTQTCCVCGAKHKMKLTDRLYKCPDCGNEIDRDLNACINMQWYGEKVKKARAAKQRLASQDDSTLIDGWSASYDDPASDGLTKSACTDTLDAVTV